MKAKDYNQIKREGVIEMTKAKEKRMNIKLQDKLKGLRVNSEEVDLQQMDKTITGIRKILEIIKEEDASVKEQQSVVTTLLEKQDGENGFWMLFPDRDMPSDARVEYMYTPTYYATAILITVLLKNSNHAADLDFMQALAKGLHAATLRNFYGHGYDAVTGFLNTIEIYLKTDINRFLDEYPDLCPAFTEMWLKAGGHLVQISLGFETSGFLSENIMEKKRAADLLDEHLNRKLKNLPQDGRSFYFAYGSNMSIKRMNNRCPGSVFVSQAYLPNYDLCYRQSLSGHYASVDAKSDHAVPLAIWSVTDSDTQALDKYEGVGNKSCYVKEESVAVVGSSTLKGLIYRLPEHRPVGAPTDDYVKIIRDAYENLGFDRLKHILENR